MPPVKRGKGEVVRGLRRDFPVSEGKNPSLRDWFPLIDAPKQVVHRGEWFAERLNHSLVVLRDLVSAEPDVMRGMPVIRGTRFPLSRVFAELADGLSIMAIADDFELDPDSLRELMDALACYFGRPVK